MRAEEPDRVRLRLWLRLLAASNAIERPLRRRVRAEFGTTLPRFDVLAALERAPHPLSMSELSRRLMVTNGNTTVLVGALERDGLVRRSVAPGDRRSFTVELTDAGRAAFAAIAEAHARWVAELLGAVGDADCERLSTLLHDVRVAVEAGAATTVKELR